MIEINRPNFRKKIQIGKKNFMVKNTLLQNKERDKELLITLGGKILYLISKEI